MTQIYGDCHISTIINYIDLVSKFHNNPHPLTFADGARMARSLERQRPWANVGRTCFLPRLASNANPAVRRRDLPSYRYVSVNEAKMGCASQCAKYFLCFFNFIFFVAGGAALAVGVWLFVDSNSFTDLIGKLDQSDVLNKTDTDVIRIISYILILAGALTFLISFLGYCGAMFESRCLLCLYGVLILLVLILESVVVGLAFGLKGDAEQGTRDFLKSTIKYYASNIDKTETITVTWDGIMTQLHCCGVDSHLDFRESTNWTSTDKILPEACCIKENNILKDPSCPISPTSNNSYYKEGCYGAIIRTIEENAAIVIGVAAGLAFVEILVIILALHLACR